MQPASVTIEAQANGLTGQPQIPLRRSSRLRGSEVRFDEGQEPAKKTANVRQLRAEEEDNEIEEVFAQGTFAPPPAVNENPQEVDELENRNVHFLPCEGQWDVETVPFTISRLDTEGGWISAVLTPLI